MALPLAPWLTALFQVVALEAAGSNPVSHPNLAESAILRGTTGVPRTSWRPGRSVRRYPAVPFPVALSSSLTAAAAEPSGARPARPAPHVTADMSPIEIRAVWIFDREIVKAADELGLDPAPSVLYAPPGTRFPWPVNERISAAVYPGYNTVILMHRALRAPDWQLRCFARHELLHMRLDHRMGSLTPEEQAEKHREVADVQRALWNEDSRCE